MPATYPAEGVPLRQPGSLHIEENAVGLFARLLLGPSELTGHV